MKWTLWRLSLALSLAVLGAAAPARAQTNGPVYVVEAGDTLFAIAQRFGLTVETLQAANPDADPAALRIGQNLLIPGYTGVAGKLSTHAVEPGETFASLALRFGLHAETLLRLNRLVNPGLLYIHQPVVISDEPDAGAPLPQGASTRVPAGAGLLALAAAHGLNPWRLASLNQAAAPSRLVPGALVALPEGDLPLTALPLPLTAVDLRPASAQQGHTLAIKITTHGPAQISGRLGEWAVTFHSPPDDPSTHYGLVGIYRLAEPNLYPLTLQITGATGTATFEQALPVRAGQYAHDPPLTVDPATVDPAATAPEFAQIKAIVSQVTPDRLWSGLFVLPSVGQIRSQFGSLRSYNGGPYDSFHGGVDFSGGDDRPITAPAPGIVVFAGPLTVRGNATLIDHGWGVFTGYWHQSRQLVKAGDRVDTGQVIGYQGSTGRVTGPHLHWEVFVAGNQVEPLEWTETAFP